MGRFAEDSRHCWRTEGRSHENESRMAETSESRHLEVGVDSAVTADRARRRRLRRIVLVKPRGQR